MIAAKKCLWWIRHVPIKSFRKIPGKQLWECIGKDGKSFWSEAVYRKVSRRSPERKENNASDNI